MFDAILEQIEKFELARPADVRSPIWSWAHVRQAEPVRRSLHKCELAGWKSFFDKPIYAGLVTGGKGVLCPHVAIAIGVDVNQVRAGIVRGGIVNDEVAGRVLFDLDSDGVPV